MSLNINAAVKALQVVHNSHRPKVSPKQLIVSPKALRSYKG